MNNDLISRSALKELLNKTEGIEYESRTVVEEVIDNAPTVNLSLNLDNITEEDIVKFKVMWQRANSKGLLAINEDRPRGEWILKEEDCDDGGNNRYECANCHYSDIHSDLAEVPYCWHCGAEMNGIIYTETEETDNDE